MKWFQRSAVDLAAAIATGELTSSALVDDCLARIDQQNPTINAALAVCYDSARARAAAIDASVGAGDPLGPLAGVPIIIKDNLATEATPTTAGSRILEGYAPPYDATVVSRLMQAGAIVVAKANLDEFAMGSSTEWSAYGPTCNPWDTTRVPGGSSGGSAAAVAAGWAPLSLGSDTGGSIRQPAALCGVYGLKPTWGRVSRFGLIAFASSLDQIGPFARSVEDLAVSLSVIAGADPADATCSLEPVPDYRAALNRGVDGLRLGRCNEWMSGEGVDPAIVASVDAALDRLTALGAEVVDVELPSTQHALATYYVLAPAEASSNLARFDGVRYGVRDEASDLAGLYETTRGQRFGKEVQRRILLGTYALSAGYRDAYYGQAQRVRAQLKAGFRKALERCDVIVSPTSPIVAPKLGGTADPLTMYRMDEFTIGPNLAELPALSVPCGQVQGLPVGLQLVAPAFREDLLLQLAAAYEDAAGQPEVAP